MGRGTLVRSVLGTEHAVVRRVILAVGAVVAALVMGISPADAAPVAGFSPADATAAHGASPDSGHIGHVCRKGYACVHYRNIWTNVYHWTDYYSCKRYSISSNYQATWVVNNQYGDVAVAFYFADGVEWDTFYPYDSSRVWEDPINIGPTAVRPC